MTALAPGLAKTPLHELHQSLGAKMVAFAGYEMPLHYRGGISERASAYAFGGFAVRCVAYGTGVPGRRRIRRAALERLTPADVVGLRDGQMRYGLLLNDAGGIKDDFMVARLSEAQPLFLVVNAATKQSDFAYISERLQGDISVEPQPGRALLALQGPHSEAVLSRHVEGVLPLSFMKIAQTRIAGVPAIVSRSGYTGEDGFEISVAADSAEAVARALLAEPEVLAGRTWARAIRCDWKQDCASMVMISTRRPRRSRLISPGASASVASMARDFPAAERIMTELFEGPRRKRVGLRLADKTPAREGAEVVDISGATVGRVTSGGFGPSAGGPVAMAYIQAGIRGRRYGIGGCGARHAQAGGGSAAAFRAASLSQRKRG